MTTRLYITEKPSTAAAINTALGGGRHSIIQKDRFGGHYEGADFRIVYLLGHFYTLSAPSDHDERFKHWRIKDLPIIIKDHYWSLNKNPGHIGIVERQAIMNLIKRFLPSTSEIVLATDSGQEGQLIGQNVIDGSGWAGPVLRLWTSSWEPKALPAKLANLEPNKNYQGYHDAAEARAILDLAIGVNYTRLYSKLAERAGHNLKANTGRCRSPANHFVAEATRKNRSHKASDYYLADGHFKISGNNLIIANLKIPDSILLGKKHCTDQNSLEKYTGELTLQSSATISKILQRSSQTPPPQPFNLNTFGQYMAGHFGWEPDKTLSVYQKLYDQGLLSYPRVEDVFYEDEVFDFMEEILESLYHYDDNFRKYSQLCNFKNRPSVFDSSQIVEHSALCVTRKRAIRNDLSDDERDLYEAVARRLMVQFAPNRVISTTNLTIKMARFSFLAEGKTLDSSGWTAIEKNDTNLNALPALKEGDRVEFISINTVSKKTKAPSRMTIESFLETLRDSTKHLSDNVRQKIGKGQVGTGATQPGYLKELTQQGLVNVVDNKYVVSTSQGLLLDSMLPKIITSPDLTSLWEIQFRNIRAGSVDKNGFLNKVWEWLTNDIEQAKINVRFKASPLMTPCIKCDSAQLRRESKNTKGYFFWVCSNDECDHTTPDQDGKPMRPLPDEGKPCSRCGSTQKTILKKKRLGQYTPGNDRRLVVCSDNSCWSKRKAGENK